MAAVGELAAGGHLAATGRAFPPLFPAASFLVLCLFLFPFSLLLFIALSPLSLLFSIQFSPAAFGFIFLFSLLPALLAVIRLPSFALFAGCAVVAVGAGVPLPAANGLGRFCPWPPCASLLLRLGLLAVVALLTARGCICSKKPMHLL